MLVIAQSEWRRFDSSVELFSRFLGGVYDQSQLDFTLAVEDTLRSTTLGVEYPSPDPEYKLPSDWVCTTKAALVAREFCRHLRFEANMAGQGVRLDPFSSPPENPRSSTAGVSEHVGLATRSTVSDTVFSVVLAKSVCKRSCAPGLQ